jgi:hypothetical protein
MIKILLSEGAPVIRELLREFGCDAKDRILITTFYNFGVWL